MVKPIHSRRTPWETVILLCGKCSRKLDGGFGPRAKDTLREALRAELSARGRRRQVRIIETRCMGICPKKAVTTVNASAPSRILTVPRKTKAGDALDLMLTPPKHVPAPETVADVSVHEDGNDRSG